MCTIFFWRYSLFLVPFVLQKVVQMTYLYRTIVNVNGLQFFHSISNEEFNLNNLARATGTHNCLFANTENVDLATCFPASDCMKALAMPCRPPTASLSAKSARAASINAEEASSSFSLATRPIKIKITKFRHSLILVFCKKSILRCKFVSFWMRIEVHTGK